jgi:hypothetical protein
MEINPLWIPIAGIVFGTVMTIAIVAIVMWYKSRERDLQFQQDMRVREMEHLRKMKELEVEMEKAKAMQPGERASA